MKGETIREYMRGEFTVRLFTMPDTDADLSFIGEYSDTPDEFHIDRQERGEMERGTYRYFNSGSAGPEHMEEDYRRMQAYNRGDWAMLGVCADILWRGKTIGHSALWGIESDAGDYITTVAREQAHEAIDEARKELEAMRAALCRKETR